MFQLVSPAVLSVLVCQETEQLFRLHSADRQIGTRSVNLLNGPSDLNSTRGKAAIVFLLFPQKSWCCKTVIKEFPCLVNTIKKSYLFQGLHFLYPVLCHLLPFDPGCSAYGCMSDAIYRILRIFRTKSSKLWITWTSQSCWSHAHLFNVLSLKHLYELSN